MMIRQENVTSRDLELLNVALDHALTPQEQVEFNKRLSECPYLTTLYQQQRRLKNSMGQLPCYQVPHNFTLTRAEARKAKRAGFLQPMFGWASLVSALLVAVIFGSELIFRNLAFPAPMAADSPQVYSLQEDAPMTPITEESQGLMTKASGPVYLLNWSNGAAGIGGIGGMGGGGDGVADSGGFSINIMINPVATYTEEIASETTGTEEMIEETPMEDIPSDYVQEEFVEQEVIEPEPPQEETVMSTPVQLEPEAPKIYGIDPEKVGTIIKMTPDSSPLQPAEPSEDHTRIIEEKQPGTMIPTQVRIALLAAAFVFGLIWLFLKFKR